MVFYAAVFALMHFPNTPLTLFCFLLAIILVLGYIGFGILLSIALFHAVLGTLCSLLLLMYTQVEPSAQSGQWHKTYEAPVLFAMGKINGIATAKNDNIVKIGPGVKTISLQGWVTPRKGTVDQILVTIHDQTIAARYGIKRKDVARFFKNPRLKNTGFIAKLPATSTPPGRHRIRIEVTFKDRLFAHHIPEKILVDIP